MKRYAIGKKKSRIGICKKLASYAWIHLSLQGQSVSNITWNVNALQKLITQHSTKMGSFVITVKITQHGVKYTQSYSIIMQLSNFE